MQRVAIFVFVLALAAVSAGSVYAQSIAQISGTVTDQSGAVLPGVEMTATQTDTGVIRTTLSNETGFYVLPNLPLGAYRLEAALPGFRTFVQMGIVLQVNSSPVINASLTVGQVSEQIEVEANAAQVETRSVGVGQVIDNQRILDLPLNGRQVTQLITLSGAAVQTGTSPTYTMDTGVRIAVAGSNDFGVQYSLDGAPHIEFLGGTGMPLPFPDALQEFRVVASTQDAANGMRAGASVNAVTRSGTNAFHGSLFEFVRNNKLNARDFFATKDDGLKRNQFGGTIGGPLQRDKLFVFGGVQTTTIRQRPADTTVFIPTAQMLAGDFTTFASPACNSGRQLTLGGGFVNNRIDPTLFSPAAMNISSRLPKPLDACGRYVTGGGSHRNDVQIPVRVDYQLNGKHTLFGRYLLTRQNAINPYDLSRQDVLSNTGNGLDDTSQSLTIGSTYLFSTNVVNAIRLSGNRISTLHSAAQYFGPQDVGINLYSYLPKWLSVNVAGGFNLGSSIFSAGTFAHVSNFGVSDDVSIVHGSHQFGFGGHVLRSLLWHSSPVFGLGQFVASGQTSGAGLGDFLLGRISSFRQATPNPENITQNLVGLYAQDVWKVTRKLTMSYGVRWDPYLPMSFKQSDLFVFNLAGFYANRHSTVYPSAPPGFTYPGDPGFYGKSGSPARWWQFNPRVGLAWDPSGDGKTAIRIGGGFARDLMRQDLHESTSNVSPFRLTVIRSAVSLDNPWIGYTGGNPFPYFFNRQNPYFAPYGSYLPVPPDLRQQLQYTWNLAIQRQVTNNFFASVNYIGSHLIHQWGLVEQNPAQFLGFGPCTLQTVTGPVSYPVCTAANNVDQRRILNLANPQAGLGYVTQYDDGGTQGYNGMLLDVRWRATERLSLSANYTWSHCIGLLPAVGVANPGGNRIHQPYQNNGSVDRNLDMGDCTSDRRHLFNATAVFRTPRFANAALRAIASDWALSTIYQQRSGTPLSIAAGSNRALNGFASNGVARERPNQVLANPYGDRSALANYFNAAAFAQPDLGTYGNVGESSVVGPEFWQWDQSLSREFQIRENQRIEVRAEAFNVTNSLRRGNPGVTLSNLNTFGRITSSAGGPRIMQFALKYVF